MPLGAAAARRLRGELQATRDENARLRTENFELQRALSRSLGKLDLIDSILHQPDPGATQPLPGGAEPR